MFYCHYLEAVKQILYFFVHYEKFTHTVISSLYTIYVQNKLISKKVNFC